MRFGLEYALLSEFWSPNWSPCYGREPQLYEYCSAALTQDEPG